MTTTLPPDPYLALGVPKNADAATIKSTYRKLVLRCHPDKVTDESLKKQKQEEFHKIQQAYEIIGDEEKRATYDTEARLEQLRRERPTKSGNSPHVDIKTTHYDVRTAAPAGASASASFGARGPPRHENPKSSRAYDDDRYYESRKYDTYEAYPKHNLFRMSRPEKEPIRVTRVTTDRSRSDTKKTRDREERRERSSKYAPFASVEEESSNDEKVRYEADYRRRNADEEARRQAAEARIRAENERDRRSYEDSRRHRSSEEDIRERKLRSQESDAMNYIRGSKGEADARPSTGRTSSARDRPEYYESRSSRRPEAIRRSSARTKDRPSSSGRDSHRDRKIVPEIVEWGKEDRKIPTFKHSSSSPADLHVPPRMSPQRSYTESSRDSRRTSPTPIRRSETMPSVPSSSSRRMEGTRPSGLRNSETATPHDSGYSSSSPPKQAFPSVPPLQSTTRYYYATAGGGVQLSPEDIGVANGHRTVTREPERHRASSPTPLSKPPMGANRPTEPLGRSPTINVSPVRGDDRGRSQKLYREISPSAIRRENARHQSSFSPERVSYARRYVPEDIRWSSRRDRFDSDRAEYVKPDLQRHATSVY
ncbi:DnaJ-domain-containing protein [Lojkania enalia]|uniref:DnaJ-domain-containing protein n=1 Tax=Lojkania enalia TaxID=147567 RepID=A0A9P4K5K4_9PLEO|nr:DnaJ-domain-containing protein [Didymosphaeria enalia]